MTGVLVGVWADRWLRGPGRARWGPGCPRAAGWAAREVVHPCPGRAGAWARSAPCVLHINASMSLQLITIISFKMLKGSLGSAVTVL